MLQFTVNRELFNQLIGLLQISTHTVGRMAGIGLGHIYTTLDKKVDPRVGTFERIATVLYEQLEQAGYFQPEKKAILLALGIEAPADVLQKLLIAEAVIVSKKTQTQRSVSPQVY